jgi:uncharacterized membrane protein
MSNQAAVVADGGLFTGRAALATSVAQVLVQIVLVIGMSRLLAFMGKKFNQPLVIWEVHLNLSIIYKI